MEFEQEEPYSQKNNGGGEAVLVLVAPPIPRITAYN